MSRRTEKIVYRVTNNVNDNCYIGWCTDIKERKARHLKAADKGVDTHFYNAIRKYGADVFTWEILYDNLESFDECKRLERELIAQYDSYYNGYNSTLGGDGGDTYSKLSEERKKEFRQKCGENAAQIWKGKKLSKEHKDKMKTARKKQDMATHYHSVNQLDNNGILIKTWDSIKEADYTLQISRSNISHSIRAREQGIYHKAGGFYWEYNKNK
jgi:group I intron endonuclease